MALWVAAAVYPAALRLDPPQALLLAGLGLGLANAVVRPVLLVLTLPLNLLTLGLFTWVVNGLLLYGVVWALGLPHGGLLRLWALSLLVSGVSLLLAKLLGV